MTRCIIHVGMHKTGTSSIQKSLNGFSDGRHLYANLGGVGNHSVAMYSLFARHPEQHHVHKTARRSAASLQEYLISMRADLERSIAALDGRTLVISGEDIGVLAEADLVPLRQYFRKRFTELTIVAYVRAPAGFMASAFQQRVKGGSIGHLTLAKEYRPYRPSFAKFDALFGRENVHLWKFDPATFPEGCVVRDFCSRLGIALAPERIARVNESLSRQAVAMLYAYRLFGQQVGSREMRAPEGQRLGAVLAAVGKDKFRFSPDVVRPILEQNRTDIDWMEKRLGQSLDEALGVHRPGDVREESDLLAPDPEAAARLRALVGAGAADHVRGDTPAEIALLVHALRGLPLPKLRQATGSAEGAGRNSGRILCAERGRVMGWAIGPDPALPVQVALAVNGTVVARAVADKERPRLKEQGVHPTGHCGFAFRFGPGSQLKEGDQVTVTPVDGSFALEDVPCVVR